VVEGTADRYREAYERLTGEPFDAYRERSHATEGDDDAAIERLREASG
jgi:hypothetical protein